MAILGASLFKGGTYVDPTGGTVVAFSDLGGELRNRQVYLDGTLPLDRTEVTFASKEARVKSDAPNGYTQPRRSMVIRVPLVLANGNRTVNTARVELSVDVETPITEIDNIRGYVAHAVAKSFSNAFWRSGSTE